MAEKIYPKGIRVFNKRDNAPSFVLGTVVISMNELIQFAKDNPQYLTEYKEQKQLKLQLLTGDKGPYLVVDTYKKDEKGDDTQLPF